MKIGIMLRHLSQHGGGVKVYTDNFLRQLPHIAGSHEIVLLHRGDEYAGMYCNGDDIRDLVLRNAPSLLWDQIMVRKAEKAENLDLIFNPKYSIPLSTKCKTAFVCHGLDWYVMPWASRWIDRLSHKYLIPRYSRKADAILAVSDTARNHVIEFLGVDEERVHTVPLGVDDDFREDASTQKLEEIKEKYSLPERYYLYVGQIYPPKNFGRLIRAYSKVGPKSGISLVVAGTHTWLSKNEIALIDELGISEWVVRPGWIERDNLPVFYKLAEALVMPSLYEAFPIPIAEAMSSGCPVVTSDRHGSAELAGDAAVIVNPEDIDSIAGGMSRVSNDAALRQRLIEKGRHRSSQWTWARCAQKTLNILDNVLEA